MTVYLVLPMRDLSGAEKRFVGMWLHLQRQNVHDVHLVTTESLFERACADRELADVSRHRGRALLAPSTGRARFVFAPILYRLWLRDPRSVFHFIMQAPGPLELPFLRRTLFTIPDPHIDHYTSRGLAQLLLGVTVARRVDMLDPVLYDKFRTCFFFKRGSFSLTPNSFVDLDSYAPAPVREKTNTMAFVGRFHEEKQVRRLIETLPEVDAALKARGFVAPAYRILGRGGDDVVRRCIEIARAGVDVEAAFEAEPQRVLARSKVFFSLQKSNNYPSKSLLEAMACGNVPVVTDVGTTERIAPRDLALYVPRDFSAGDIARACERVLGMSDDDLQSRVETMRNFLGERFSIRSMADYFLGLYRVLSE